MRYSALYHTTTCVLQGTYLTSSVAVAIHMAIEAWCTTPVDLIHGIDTRSTRAAVALVLPVPRACIDRLCRMRPCHGPTPSSLTETILYIDTRPKCELDHERTRVLGSVWASLHSVHSRMQTSSHRTSHKPTPRTLGQTASCWRMSQ